MRLWPTLLLLAIASASACSVYDPNLLNKLPPVDAGDDSAIDMPGCEVGESMTLPSRPKVTTSDNEDTRLDLVLRDLDFARHHDDWRSIGYNLDAVCTKNTSSPSQSCQSESVITPIDGIGGVDNQFLAALATPILDTPLPNQLTGAETVSNALGRGWGNIVLRISKWNGGEDEQVQVELLQSLFATSNPNGETEPPLVDSSNLSNLQLEDGTPLALPKFVADNPDWFWIRDDSYLDAQGQRAALVNDTAFVTAEGKLVVQLSTAPLKFVGIDISSEVQLNEGIIVVDLSDPDAKERDVTVAGRWAISQLHKSLQSIGICPGTDIYETLATIINTQADIRENGNFDGDGSRPCNAISIGMRSTAVPLKIAGIAATPPTTDGCRQ